MGALLGVLACWFLIAWYFHRDIGRCWAEPVLIRPVVVFESDDWGTGGETEAKRLESLMQVLEGFKDRCNRHPVVTLGVVLAGPDRKRIRGAGCREYFRRYLGEGGSERLLRLMETGQKRGVFALQLHGMEHYWPPAVMAAAASDAEVRQWLAVDDTGNAQVLPPRLQSRWVDGAVLPSKPIPVKRIRVAAADEVEKFRRIFGFLPRVVVPPTFVWTGDVESAWIENGVRVIVTPGVRYTGRDGEGRPAGVDKWIYNGASAPGAVYMVRDIYFEPTLGAGAKETAARVMERFCLGRPALLEMHEFNFTSMDDEGKGALEELRGLIGLILRLRPDACFMSTEELADKYRKGAEGFFELCLAVRIRVWLARLGRVRRLRKLAWVTGMVVPARMLWIATHLWRRDGGKRRAGAPRLL